MWQRLIGLGLLLFSGAIYGRTISPNEFGLQKAATGEARYEVLLKTHSYACKHGYKVSYKGIATIDLTIPSDSKPIPLSDRTDFCGVVLNVKNNTKDSFLFNKIADTKQVEVSPSSFSSYNFRDIAPLREGNIVLIVQDNNPWVDNRTGHDYGATRKDILFLKHGIAKNQTIATYDNKYSSPLCLFFVTTKKLKYFKNVVFNRDPHSTHKTLLFKIENIFNLEICGITINTPPNDKLYGDAVMMINNCANLNCHDVTINGTYSRTDMYGYGISMDNVWNSRFDNIIAKCNYGVFGNNNIQQAYITNSTINRFDIHCYGRNLFFENVDFTQTGLSIGSFYGNAVFNKCTFTNAVPCACRKDYNAYTPFDLEFSNCVFSLTRRYCYIINLASIPTVVNSRAELSQKCIPNVVIKDCIFHLANDMKEWTLYYVGDGAASENYSFGHVDNILVINNQVESDTQPTIKVFNRDVYSKNDVNVNINGLSNNNSSNHLDSNKRNNRIVVNIRKK